MEIVEGHTKIPPDNMATFEHLDDRFSEDRGKHPNEFRVVLACLKCNNARGREREAARLIDELRARSGRLGRGQ